VIFSVKAGHVVPTYIDALWGVMEREGAEIGVLISFNEPTPGMRVRAAEAEFYESPWGKHPRIQLRTVGELLDGKGIDYPHVTGANVTQRAAARAAKAAPESLKLFETTPDVPVRNGAALVASPTDEGIDAFIAELRDGGDEDDGGPRES